MIKYMKKYMNMFTAGCVAKLIKQLSVLVVCLACFSCANNQYHINGIITANNGTEIYLINLDCNDTLAVTAVEGNKFSFDGKIQEPAYTYVGYGKVRVRFILEPGEVTVDLDERKAKGTPITDAIEKYSRRYYSFNTLRNEERKALIAKKESITPEEFNAQWVEINQKYLAMQADVADSVICANPDNIMGAQVMPDLALTDTVRFIKRFNEVSDFVKNYKSVQNSYKAVCALNRTAPGMMFTDYTIKGGNIDGTDVKLSDYVGKGNYILLDHWASWCGPCKAEMPHLKKAYEMFKDKNFSIVGVAVSDKRDDTMKSLEALALPWNQIVDAQGVPKELYGVTTIPHLILFGPDGTILKRGLRGEQIIAELTGIFSDK